MKNLLKILIAFLTGMAVAVSITGKDPSSSKQTVSPVCAQDLASLVVSSLSLPATFGVMHSSFDCFHHDHAGGAIVCGDGGVNHDHDSCRDLDEPDSLLDDLVADLDIQFLPKLTSAFFQFEQSLLKDQAMWAVVSQKSRRCKVMLLKKMVTTHGNTSKLTAMTR